MATTLIEGWFREPTESGELKRIICPHMSVNWLNLQISGLRLKICAELNFSEVLDGVICKTGLCRQIRIS